MGRTLIPSTDRYSKNKPVYVSIYNHYRDITSTKVVDLERWLLTHRFQNHVEEIRQIGHETKWLRDKLKSRLPCITPSGIFKKREDCGLIKHSGFVCLDIDLQDNPGLNPEEAKTMLAEAFDSLYYAGLSVSGEGLFLLFKIKAPELHAEHYAALVSELQELGFTADRSCKNLSRLRGASYDSAPYFNPRPKPYSKIKQLCKGRPGKPGKVVREIDDFKETREHVQAAIDLIRERRIDITDEYPVWVKIGYAFASEYGEEGRYYFHRVSRISSKYDWNECEEQYDKCLRAKTRVGIGTFFYHCKRFGVMYRAKRP